MSTPADPWAVEAPGWDTNPAVVAYAEAAYASLCDAVPLSPHHRVLDFGCGTGLLSARLAPQVAQVVAVDASPAMIAVLDSKGLPGVVARAVQWTPSSIAVDPLAARPFDLIVCSSVLAFVPDHPATVAMLAALLSPGGHLVQWDWERDPSAEQPHGLSADAITRAMASAGLEVISVQTGFDVPFASKRMRPLMGVARRPARRA